MTEPYRPCADKPGVSHSPRDPRARLAKPPLASERATGIITEFGGKVGTIRSNLLLQTRSCVVPAAQMPTPPLGRLVPHTLGSEDHLLLLLSISRALGSSQQDLLGFSHKCGSLCYRSACICKWKGKPHLSL